MRKYLDFQGAELVPFGTPKPLHGVNPRQLMRATEWDRIRKETYEKFNHKCAICGASGLDQGFSWSVEAHEIWDYDFDTCTQYFEGLVALCPICHKTIHWQQNEMAYMSGSLSFVEFERQQDLKMKKLIEVSGGNKLIHKRKHPWHEVAWVSDFSKLKDLYPDLRLPLYFDTKWNGFFGRGDDDYIYKPLDEDPIKRLF